LADMRYVLPPADAVTISGAAADVLIRSGDGAAALVYLHIARCGGEISPGRAAKTLNLPEKDVAAAIERLFSLGLIKRASGEGAPAIKTAPVKDELPEYSIEEVRHEITSGSVFAALVKEVQKDLGKILTSDDLVRLFGMYDYLGLPPDVIYHLVRFCIDEHTRRYGEGRRPTIRYIEKVAYSWEREGVKTLEDAEAYISRLERQRDRMSEILRILQIRDRLPSATERRYIEGWVELGIAPELIEMAYDKTLVQTGRLAWKYLDTILKSWHAAGLKTTQDVLRADGKPEKKPAASGYGTAPGRGGAGNGAMPDESDIKRMENFLKKLKGE
jgi:DnaD/phage-associated family protein